MILLANDRLSLLLRSSSEYTDQNHLLSAKIVPEIEQDTRGARPRDNWGKRPTGVAKSIHLRLESETNLVGLFHFRTRIRFLLSALTPGVPSSHSNLTSFSS